MKQLYIKVMMEFRMSEGFTFSFILTPYLFENYILPLGIGCASKFSLSFNYAVNVTYYLNMPGK